MKRSIYLLGALYGMLTSLIVMALSYVGNSIFTLPFFPFDLFDWLTRHLPGAVIDTVIRVMVSIITALGLGPTDTIAKLAENIQALILVMITGIGFGVALAIVKRFRMVALIRAGLLGGLILWLGLVIVEFSIPSTPIALALRLFWLLGLIVGWGWALSSLIAAAPDRVVSSATLDAPGESHPERFLGRRGFLTLAGSSLASLVVLAIGLRNFHNQAKGASIPGDSTQPTHPQSPSGNPALFGPEYTSGSAASPALDVLAQRIEPAPNTRAEITSVEKFYEIDINQLPSVINAQSWKLELKGLVQKPLSFTLAELRALPSITQAVTLECVSNPLGGDLIGTNFWTGVPLKNVLLQAATLPEAKGIAITSADGFYEYVPLAEAMDDRTLLVYAMNAEPLTTEHGYPLRIYIPNHYGMKQPKWIIGMEVTNSDRPGFWTERGWEAKAIAKTTSVIDTLAINRNVLQTTGIVPVGGIAWAGARGIQRVEIQIDTTPWVDAVLRSPALSPLTWVQWRYDWRPGLAGVHTIRVRATDGDGNLQDATLTNPGPEGATGIYSTVVFI